MADSNTALRKVAALVSAALRNGPPALEAEIYPVAFLLGAEALAGPEAMEKALREALGLKACLCSIDGPGEVVPFACPVHGVPCDECGGLEACAEGCGDRREPLPDEGDWAEVAWIEDDSEQDVYLDEHGGTVRIVFWYLGAAQAVRRFSPAKQEEFAQLYVAACNQAAGTAPRADAAQAAAAGTEG